MGFLVSLGTILLAGLVSLAGFAMVWQWQTAAIFFGSIGVGTVAFLRFHENHHRSEAYDDRLTDETMREAQEYLVRRWEHLED